MLVRHAEDNYARGTFTSDIFSMRYAILNLGLLYLEGEIWSLEKNVLTFFD